MLIVGFDKYELFCVFRLIFIENVLLNKITYEFV